MNAMVPGLKGTKMSSSEADSKIDFLDTPEQVRKKVKDAFCEEGNIDNNGLLSFVQAVLIPISQLRIDRLKGDEILEAGTGDQKPFVGDGAPEGTVFSVVREEKHGGSLHYKSFEDMQTDFKEKKIHPKDLKTAVGNGIVNLLEPIRKAFEENEEWQKIEKLAYPDVNAKPEKKKKKVGLHSSLLAMLQLVGKLVRKVYPPPPPGKGKNVAKPAAADEVSNVEVTHAEVEQAKQQPAEPSSSLSS